MTDGGGGGIQSSRTISSLLFPFSLLVTFCVFATLQVYYNVYASSATRGVCPPLPSPRYATGNDSGVSWGGSVYFDVKNEWERESLEVRGSETLRFLTTSSLTSSRSGSSIIIIIIVTIFIIIIIPCRTTFLANDNSSDMQKLTLTFDLQDWCSPGKPSFSFNLFHFQATKMTLKNGDCMVCNFRYA